jgi:hypothetical protein
LDHVAIHPDGSLAQPFQIRDRAKRTANEALNFLRAPRLLSAAGFARRALFRGAREHSVFAGYPAFA